MILTNWAAKWGIPYEAIADLRSQFGADTSAHACVPGDDTNEATVMARVRLAAADNGEILWRANSGAAYDPSGRLVRYGLANENALDTIACSDLIGIKPIRISDTLTIGQFYAREAKPSGWQYTGTKHEAAQLRFLQIVASYGGDAAFTNGG